tara:strand:+ start:9340 stop:9930 length:591 start_codon:yes stop_codon:yes gene_type:complete
MKLIQNKRFGPKRTFELKNGKIHFRYESLSVRKEWFVNVLDLDSSRSDNRYRPVGTWCFTGVFVVLLVLTLAGVTLADENSGLFLASSIFLVVSPIAIVLGTVKGLKESSHWVILNYRNGSPALHLYPKNPSKDQLEQFIGEVFRERELSSGSGGEILRAIESLSSAGLLNEKEYRDLQFRAASHADLGRSNGDER